MMARLALIPSYEPDEKLVQVATDLHSRGFKVVVVNDGSGAEYDSLFERVSRFSALISYGENHGKGYALKRGLEYIQENYSDSSVVVTVDGDGQHGIDDVCACADKAEKKPRTLVLGCRSFDGDIPLKSKLGNKFTRLVYKLFCGLTVSDTQTGLRAFTVELIPFLLSIDGTRYEYEMNVLLECSKKGIEIREIPIKTIYENGNAGSHFRAFRDSLIIYRDIFKFAGSSFLCFLLDYALFGLLLLVFAPFGAFAAAASNVVARVCSATVNFNINRKLVFESDGSIVRAAAGYFALACGILVGNTLLLTLFVDILLIPALVAKLVVEALFFMVSWTVQRQMIFRKEVG